MAAEQQQSETKTGERGEKKLARSRFTVSPIAAIRALLKNYFVAVISAAVVALLLRVYVIEAFRIPTDFMSPTLLAGDHIFVNKLAYRGFGNRSVRAGDVVIFSLPHDPAKDYIKRVVAIAGDEVEIRSGELILNGKSVSKAVGPDLFEETVGTHVYSVQWQGAAPEARNMVPVKVPSGQIFVLGDNRAKGQDSRTWGFLSAALVKGRAWFVWFSSVQGDENEEPWGVRWSRLFLTIK